MVANEANARRHMAHDIYCHPLAPCGLIACITLPLRRRPLRRLPADRPFIARDVNRKSAGRRPSRLLSPA